MNELIRHIEHLIQENECVIVPGLGGFISHYCEAKWIDEEALFLPPKRSVGFNKLLHVNDGLLIQSYMSAYQLDYDTAAQRVNLAVSELITTLQKKGRVNITGIGCLTYTAAKEYEFEPNEDGIVSPSLFGLSSFQIDPLASATPSLSVVKAEEHANGEKTMQLVPSTKGSFTTHPKRRPRNLFVAVVIALVFFFSFSTPVENTYISQENYAELLSLNMEGSTLFNKVNGADTSIPDKIINKEELPDKTTATIQESEALPNLSAQRIEVKPIHTNTFSSHTAKETKKVQQEEPKTTTVQKLNKKLPVHSYHIVVASLRRQRDAKKVLSSLTKKGYNMTQIINVQGKLRVSLNQYTTKEEAQNALREIRKINEFKNSWIFHSI